MTPANAGPGRNKKTAVELNLNFTIQKKRMNYEHIKNLKISHAQIAKAFGYKNVNSFRCSSAHKRHMRGVENILKLIKTKSDN